MSIGILNRALLGIQQNQRRFELAADEVLSASTWGREAAAPRAPDPPPLPGAPPSPDMAQATLHLITARRGLEASLAVARAADEMLGTVIDELA